MPQKLHSVAVFIDFENLAFSSQHSIDLGLLLEQIASVEQIHLKRAYGDWTRLSSYRDQLLDQAIESIQVWSGNGKNWADVRIAVDAMEQLFTNSRLASFVIVSGDRDFCSLINYLREHGKYVMGIGTRKGTSRYLIPAYDDFRYYEDLFSGSIDPEGQVPPSTAMAEISPRNGHGQEDARALLQRAMEKVAKNGECSKGSSLKVTMQRFDPDFDEKRYGYLSFGSFLRAQADLVEVTQPSQGDLIVAWRSNEISSRFAEMA